MESMSARFMTNFIVLLLGAGVVVTVFAFSPTTLDWAAGRRRGVDRAGAVQLRARHQGVYQRTADVAICAVGAWAIVAARVMSYHGPWLVFGAGAALAALGAIGLVVREARLPAACRSGRPGSALTSSPGSSSLQRDARASR